MSRLLLGALAAYLAAAVGLGALAYAVCADAERG